MLLLHLSDLHIGKTVNGFSMLSEQRNIFAQIIGYIQKVKPDAVLIAGDIYDRAVPGVEAVRLFDDFLTELAMTEVTVFLISGNHDSPERLNYASRLLSERKLHICGMFDGKLKSASLSDEYGGVDFWLLPFIKPSSVRGMFSDKAIESYTDAVLAVLDSAEIDYNRRNVILSHQFYTSVGTTPILSDSEINPVGGLDAVDASILSRFDYAALGHLHGGQSVKHNVRYAGSPLKYSLSEKNHSKGVTLVTLREKGDVEVTTLPLTPLHNMREIKGPIDMLMSEEISSQGDKEDYMRIVLTDEEDIIDPINKLRTVYPNIMDISFDNSRTQREIFEITADAERVGKLSTYELFSEFFLQTSGAVMTEAQAEIVRELLEGGAAL